MEPKRSAYESSAAPASPADLASMYQPYAGSYSESYPPRPAEAHKPSINEPAMPAAPSKPEHADKKNPIGMDDLSPWRAFRLAVYIFLRLAQLVLAAVTMGLIARVQHNSTVEKNTEIAIYVIGGITMLISVVSITCHVFARTRQRVERSRLMWLTGLVNFAVFVVWIVLVLIMVVAVDCSQSSWCKSVRVGLALALVSAMLALVMVLRSFSVLVRAKRVKLWA
ncbi:hypothetical protein GGI25_001475 [Coemansia spiralis]|uniref:Uncharacterized protein n=2 Tax=Coemansia TaxID=4863 RepID=A0A9W8L032_9FUNG|nr:hypothetical protein BX070DRAFT_249828 [Coemansia spiralis]KAJ1994815.1 hypothetical protein EDC05_001438 [Coemansia umbellata]KAJ2624483.1 hypothetical protein GGI26_001401 [Coemansia sp. RSA 1358]KAJ2679552.1 hypothetical protein GGI25_001475 [Coemansia spiralis]